MERLLDSCLASLIDATCRDKNPVQRLQRAVGRVVELLRSIGFVDVATTLAKLSGECGECPESTPWLNHEEIQPHIDPALAEKVRPRRSRPVPHAPLTTPPPLPASPRTAEDDL